MSNPSRHPNRVVIYSVDDDNGTVLRAVTLASNGDLVIEGHDLGKGVEDFFGHREYEFERRLSPPEVARLREVLGIAGDAELLPTIKERFAHTSELEKLLVEHGIAGQFWSRVGD